MMHYVDMYGKEVNRGMQILASLWIPQKPWIYAVATGAGWYGRQVALTYGPGLVANYFINNTVAYMGAAGKVIGATIVAPAMTPAVVPWVAIATSCAAFIIAAVICNIALHIFRYCRDRRAVASEPAKPPELVIVKN
jgi:hypothetical protein